MIEIKQVKTEDQELYGLLKSWCTRRFCTGTRDTPQQREYSDSNPLFCNNVIVEDGKPVGMISYWDMGDLLLYWAFCHRPLPAQRGLRQRVLESIQTKLQGPIILEVEEPTEEMSIRRINFYKRLNFTLHEKPYMQPPYRTGDSGLPMLLMTYGDIDMEKDFDKVKNMLYKEVYGQPVWPYTM